jgi:hypothetical protein
MKKKLKKVCFFYAQINRYVFDVLNESHTTIILFILVDPLALQFVPDWTIYFLQVKFEVEQALPSFFRLSVRIHLAWNLQLYFRIIEFH